MVSKAGARFTPVRSDGDALSATVAAPGLEAARARIGLKYGTLEPVVSMFKGKAQADNPQGQEYRCEAQGRNDP